MLFKTKNTCKEDFVNIISFLKYSSLEVKEPDWWPKFSFQLFS